MNQTRNSQQEMKEKDMVLLIIWSTR